MTADRTISVEGEAAALEISSEQRTKVADLADRLYEHVFYSVDHDRLHMLEQLLGSELRDIGIDPVASHLTDALLAEALHRVGGDPMRNILLAPPGITAVEELASEYDDDCSLCRAEALEGRRAAEPTIECELDRSFREEAERWRDEHKESLQRFGLA